TIGCTGSASVTVPEGVIIETTVVSTDASCFNSPNGAATVIATGGVEPYTYAWSDILHQTSATAVNLAPGTYTVTVTDSTGCSTVDTAMIQSPPPIELALNSTPVSCAGGSDGSVSVTVVSGINGPFIMQWNDPANSTGSVVNDLPAGSYFVIVSDTMGCAATGSVEVTEPSPIVLSFASQPASCFNSSDGSLEVTATGGTTASPGVYQYAWDAPGNPAVSVLDDVTPGTYSVTVTDDNGCTAVGSVTIDAPDSINISFDLDPISCFGANDAGLSANVSGGQAPFSYNWSVAGATDTSAVSNLSPGNYSLTVTDANGCAANENIEITEPEALIVLTSAVDVLCSSDADGQATANPQGGTSPYNFNWSEGQTTQSASGLAPGSYSVTVTDAHGCQSSATAVVSYTSDFAISTTGNDVNCYAGSDGSATVNATGGSAPYTFAWSNGDSASIAANLSAGTFSVTVVDAAGCVLTDSVSIGEP
ncbi:MAG: hypothetical protein D6698_07550, partial [Gammaproteobacteria bacterium]